jgi:hypothetical protein
VANPRKLRLIHENQRKNDRVDAKYVSRVARLDPKRPWKLEHRSESGQNHLLIIRARTSSFEPASERFNIFDRRSNQSTNAFFPEPAKPSTNAPERTSQRVCVRLWCR